MGMKIFWTAFGAILLAEVADKTNLAVISLVAKSRSPLAVFLGSVVAFSIVTLLGVLFGEALIKFIPAHYIRYLAGGLFVVIGILILSGRM